MYERTRSWKMHFLLFLWRFWYYNFSFNIQIHVFGWLEGEKCIGRGKFGQTLANNRKFSCYFSHSCIGMRGSCAERDRYDACKVRWNEFLIWKYVCVRELCGMWMIRGGSTNVSGKDTRLCLQILFLNWV